MNSTIALEARNVRKTYGRVEALRGVDVAFRAGEITALIGDNGAGKSTLVKILSGATTPDSGDIVLDGQPVVFATPHQARGYGVETVYQDLALAPDLDGPANLYLGRELVRPGLLGRLGFLDNSRMNTFARAQFDDLGVTLQDSRVPIASMSGGQRQSIAVGRSATWANKVLFLDEPTAALGVVQTRRVLDLMVKVKEKGIAVVLISHSMQDVLAVADHIEVLRLGTRVASLRGRDADVELLVGALTGAIQIGG